MFMCIQAFGKWLILFTICTKQIVTGEVTNFRMKKHRDH